MFYRYFSENEFKNLTPSCSLSDMDEDFMSRLDNARHLSGFPFVLTSAYRSVDYEHSKGRSGASYHCKGCAVDISCRDSSKRFVIVQNLMRSGFKGIGIAKTFIHVDSRANGIIFLY